MKKLLDNEGPLISFLNQCAQLIVLSVLWLLWCLPVVTVLASTAALYEATVESVRHQQRSACGVFWRSFRKHLLPGMLLFGMIFGAFAVLEAVSVFLLGSVYPSGVLCVLMILNSFVAVYAPPVLARFHRGATDSWKLSFLLSVQFAHYTLLLLIGSLLLAAMQIFVFPMATILVLPGAWCWCSSFLMEKALNRSTLPGA